MCIKGEKVVFKENFHADEDRHTLCDFISKMNRVKKQGFCCATV